MFKKIERSLVFLVVIVLFTALFAVPGVGASNSLNKSVAGWIPYWDQSRDLASVQNNPDVFAELSPFWYDLGSSGQLITLPNAEDSSLISYAKQNDKKLIPLISNEFDPAIVSNIINSASLKQTLVNNIVTKVVNMGYTGIELDFENLYTTDKAAFTAFVQSLAAALHNQGKVLVVTVQAKTSDTNTWNGPGAQDYAALGQAVDLIRVMAYDYHWNTSTAGSIAPASWVEQVLKYSVSKIAPGKLVLGIPDYGYDWVGSRGKGITYSQALAAAANYKATITQDANNGPHFSYVDTSGISHEVWFQDALSITTFLNLTNKYNVYGIAIWRLGGEDPNLYQAIRSTFTSTVAPADTVPPTVTIAYTAYKNSITITANAMDNVKVAKVLIYFDGKLIATDSSAPYVAYYKHKRTYSNHVIKAIAYDTTGNSSTAQVTINW